MRRLLTFLCVIFIAVFFMGTPGMAEEKITLTTYYPAPYGNYEELQATSLGVGSTVTVPATDGDLHAVGTIRSDVAFNLNGTDGASRSLTVVTSIDFLGMSTTTSTITIEGGIITSVVDN